MMKKAKTLFLLGMLIMGSVSTQVKAGEGMWLPLLLGAMQDDMQSNGLKLSAEEIYSINQSSMKDAVAQFGGCTGAMISSEGLMLTNHHCALGRIQAHSSVEHDYLSQGFWAKTRAEELPNPGQTATFIVRIEDVSQQVLEGMEEGMEEAERESLIEMRSMALAREAVSGTHYGAMVRPFYNGNEYYLFVVETFRDVRLVGAPPNSIGTFGGDTDNWVWPRHNADFTLFRVYSGPDGLPADYSPDNIPLQPRHFFPISLKPKQPGDFTLVYGFPGRTQEYLPSSAVEMIMETVNPIRIGIRDISLSIIDAEMAQNDTVRIQYTKKQQNISNGYKKWKGELWGLKKTGALEKKKAYEAEFQARVDANPDWKAKYGSLLSGFQQAYEAFAPLTKAREYLTEAGLGIEVVAKAWAILELEKVLDPGFEDENKRDQYIEKVRDGLPGFFKNFTARVDRQVMAALLERYMADTDREQWPAYFAVIDKKFKGDTRAFAEKAFATSLFTDQARFEAFLDAPRLKVLQKDPVFALAKSLRTHYDEQIRPAYGRWDEQIDVLNRAYMAAQREVFPEKTFYPDANSTMRITYGQIEGYAPQDGKYYLAHTTLDGLVEKHRSYPQVSDFKVPPRLMELYEQKAFGPYAQDGTLWTAFVASNHTSGGNSGSPVIDGEGRLIGLNFDRTWEGTMSDINYDPAICRNISADIRYILWVIDVYAEADGLLEEMEIIKE